MRSLMLHDGFLPRESTESGAVPSSLTPVLPERTGPHPAMEGPEGV